MSFSGLINHNLENDKVLDGALCISWCLVNDEVLELAAWIYLLEFHKIDKTNNLGL